MTSISLARAGLSGAGLLLAMWLPGWAAAAGLNDTGITGCASDAQNNLTCPQAGFPSQDAETGRDAQVGLSKAGGGSAGFDFTKLDSSGNPLPADAASWDCVRDNVTGLIWEIKTDDGGLRDKDWYYTWYNSDPATNGGDAGSLGFNTCGGTLPSSQCNTQAYVAAVNALNPKLCGFSDWRMPTVEELRTIVDYSRPYPAIVDTAYFPQTLPYYYWSASPYASDPDNAWYLDFRLGDTIAYVNDKGYGYAVRLMRGGQ